MQRLARFGPALLVLLAVAGGCPQSTSPPPGGASACSLKLLDMGEEAPKKPFMKNLALIELR
ncbi:MAG: hypothetical protein KDA24_23745 [Deltaproteobacteria bacterium]|nr:hypothetical protein [Deltaproteobacteria bacterium]